MRPRALALGMMALSCSRTPEEPAPATRVTSDPESKVLAESSKPKPKVVPAPLPVDASACPIDPDPAANARFFTHGEAVFLTADGARHAFSVEIARTEPAQARGLMYRTSLAEDRGMVFEFAKVHEAKFWMRNTCIALDMVFVSEEKRVLGVVTAPPLNEEERFVPGQSKWVVELAEGVAKKHGIAIGTDFLPPK